MTKTGDEVGVTVKEYDDSSGLAALNKATNAVTEPSNIVENATPGQSSSPVALASLKGPDTRQADARKGTQPSICETMRA